MMKLMMALACLLPAGALHAQVQDIRSENHFYFCAKLEKGYFKHLYSVEIEVADASRKRTANVAIISGFRIGGTPIDLTDFEQSQELTFCQDSASDITCQVGNDINIVIPRATIFEWAPSAQHSRLRSNKATINGDPAFCSIYDNHAFEAYKRQREESDRNMGGS